MTFVFFAHSVMLPVSHQQAERLINQSSFSLLLPLYFIPFHSTQTVRVPFKTIFFFPILVYGQKMSESDGQSMVESPPPTPDQVNDNQVT